jgi:ATP-binding cassette subfamily C protein
VSDPKRARARRVLLAALRRRPGRLGMFALWSAVGSAPVLVFGRSVAGATDAFLAHRPVAALTWVAVLVCAAMVGAVGAGRAYGPLADIVEPLRDALVRHVVRGAVHESVHTGRPGDAAVARLTQQVEIVRDTFAGVLTIVQSAVFTLVSALIGLSTLLPVTLLLVVPPVVAGLALFLGMVSRSITRQRELILSEEAIAESAAAVGGGLRDIVACGTEDTRAAETGRLIDAQAATARSMARLAAGRTVALAVGGRLPLLLILVAAPWLLRHGATPGIVLGSITYVLQGLSAALGTVIHGLGGSGLRLAVTLDRVMEAAEVPQVTRPDRTGGRSDLWIRGATFAYGPEAEAVIDDLHLAVPEGDHLAVVGPSGIGKSTLARLVAGTHAPDRGTVTLGGVPATEADPTVRALIPQEAYVFGGTLRDNLRYLRTWASDEALDHAVTEVGAGRLSGRLGGYDAEVDPATLSAGERQLIALVRAYLSPARLVVLDEATCHLDAAAEERAERAFAARPGSLVVIAHRMTSARRARRTLVLDGTRAWLGTHDELLSDCALYRDLHGHWCSQPAGVVGDADRVDPVPSLNLSDDAGDVVTDGAYRQEEVARDLR